MSAMVLSKFAALIVATELVGPVSGRGTDWHFRDDRGMEMHAPSCAEARRARTKRVVTIALEKMGITGTPKLDGVAGGSASEMLNTVLADQQRYIVAK